jgi:colanic acid/amylovoran biosynthesis glycosyltransferase
VKAAELRVAFVTGTLQLGGSTTFLLNLTGELIKRGVSCHVFCGDNMHSLARDFERLGVPISLHDHRRVIFEDRLEAVLREMHDFKPNVVVATLAPFAFEVLRYVPREILRIGTVQSDDPLVYQMAEKYAGCMDGIVGVSSVIAKRLDKMSAFLGVPKHYLAYGVPIPAQPAPHAASGEPLRILYLGRLNNEQKRVHLLPQIAASLERARIPFQWTIAGDGPDRLSLEARMKSFVSATRVKFVGAVNYANVTSLLNTHDVLLLVSDYEGLPLSLVEAMGHGLVPVVSDLESGIREVVDETNGVLVPVNDVEGYARAIIYLDRHPEEFAAKSTAARDRVRTEFSAESMTNRWLAFLVPAPNKVVAWPETWQISAPLGARHAIIFTKPFRALRRLRKRLTKLS